MKLPAFLSKSLRNKLSAAILLASALAISLLTGFLYNNFYDIERESIDNWSRAEAKEAARQAEGYFNHYLAQLHQLNHQVQYLASESDSNKRKHLAHFLKKLSDQPGILNAWVTFEGGAFLALLQQNLANAFLLTNTIPTTKSFSKKPNSN